MFPFSPYGTPPFSAPHRGRLVLGAVFEWSVSVPAFLWATFLQDLCGGAASLWPENSRRISLFLFDCGNPIPRTFRNSFHFGKTKVIFFQRLFQGRSAPRVALLRDPSVLRLFASVQLDEAFSFPFKL